MKKSVPVLTALLVAASLAGCATTGPGGRGTSQGISVTRFHLGQEIARAEIRVEPANPAEVNSPAFAQLAAPVERELSRLGWTVARGNARSEQVAVVRFQQGSREAARGGAQGDVVTELGVRIQRRSDATVAWEGRAQLEARASSTLAGGAAAADRLAEALFRDFPGESGRTIRVR
jgi:hypothetical protein